MHFHVKFCVHEDIVNDKIDNQMFLICTIKKLYIYGLEHQYF